MKAALGSVPGVRKVEVDFEGKQATVVYDPGQTNPDQLVAAIHDQTRFKASVKSASP